MSILQNNKKAAAGIGVVAAAAAVLALGAGTYAAFTDTENVDATFAAGTLDLQIGGTTGAGEINFGELYPGQVITHNISVDNVGTVDGRLSFTGTVTQNDNGCNDAEQEAGGCGSGGLADVITVSVPGAPPVLLSELEGAGLSGIPLPAAPGAQSYTLTFTVDGDATSAIQSDTAVVAIEATLAQDTP